jgi:hypothetical protein
MGRQDTVDEAKRKLLEMNETIAELDPSVRAAAFDILKPYYFGEAPPPPPAGPKKRKSTQEPSRRKDDVPAGPAPEGEDEFFAAHDHKKPAENVFMIVAWLYQNHGVIPVTSTMIKEHANRIGLIVPSRPDNTMRQAKVKGKSLFVQQSKGWALTVSGQTYLKDTYKVKKGNAPLPKADDK